jgi:hypothetical protein
MPPGFAGTLVGMNDTHERTPVTYERTAYEAPRSLSENDLVEELTVAAVAPGARRLLRLEELLEELHRRARSA